MLGVACKARSTLASNHPNKDNMTHKGQQIMKTMTERKQKTKEGDAGGAGKAVVVEVPAEVELPTMHQAITAATMAAIRTRMKRHNNIIFNIILL